MRRYRRRQTEVDAIRVDGRNAAAVAAWCGGRVTSGAGPASAVLVTVGHSRVRARVGDYVCCEVGPDGDARFWPVRAAVFEWGWEPVGRMSRPGPAGRRATLLAAAALALLVAAGAVAVVVLAAGSGGGAK